MIKNKIITKIIKQRIIIMRNLGTFNKFLNGVSMTRIKPTILLMKNRG
jgi:hypothetical protein